MLVVPMPFLWVQMLNLPSPESQSPECRGSRAKTKQAAETRETSLAEGREAGQPGEEQPSGQRKRKQRNWEFTGSLVGSVHPAQDV